MKHALVVLSGGQDSTTALWMEGHDREVDHVSALTIDYGQRHLAEIDAAQKVWELFSKQFPDKASKYEVIAVPSVLAGTSPLVSPTALNTYTDRASMEAEVGNRVEATFVPMRNLLFLVLAANRALAWGCTSITIGVCEQDSANYPDCRRDFIHAAAAAINRAAEGVAQLELNAPLIMLDKADAIALGKTLPGWYKAMSLTRTAYTGEYPPVTRDHATVLREDSFRRAGIPDPMMVAAALEGLCPMPPGLEGVQSIDEAVRRVGAA